MVLQIPVQKKGISFKREVTPTHSNQENTSVTGATEEEKEIAIELAINSELETNSIENTIDIKHFVGANETIFGLSKKYDVTVEDIESVNSATLKNGLQVGQMLIIPVGKKISTKAIPTIAPALKKESEIKNKVEEYIQHKVAPKETLYGLSKKYNVSVDEIKQKNSVVLQNGLQVGQILIIKKN
jgi:LysM repeat protein